MNKERERERKVEDGDFQKLLSWWLMIELDWVVATEESASGQSQANQVFRVSLTAGS